MYKDLAKRKATHKRTEKRAVLRNTAFVRELKESTRCTDCHLFWPAYVMDFDHLRDKTDAIARFKNHSLERLKEEIAKCELVCSNCHRVRTYSRRGFDTAIPL